MTGSWIRFAACFAALLFASLVTAACGQDQITPLPTSGAGGSPPTTPIDSGDPCGRVCAPGATQLCYCPDTHQTAQVCAPDGKSWETCPCGTSPAVDASTR